MILVDPCSELPPNKIIEKTFPHKYGEGDYGCSRLGPILCPCFEDGDYPWFNECCQYYQEEEKCFPKTGTCSLHSSILK